VTRPLLFTPSNAARRIGGPSRIGPQPRVFPWGVRWRENGRRTSKSGFRSKSAALAYYRDEIRRRLLGTSSVDPGMTLEAFIALYLAGRDNISPNIAG
jgi:hypothetical protein